MGVLPLAHRLSALNSRVVKMAAHCLFPSSEYVLYMDSKMEARQGSLARIGVERRVRDAGLLEGGVHVPTRRRPVGVRIDASGGDGDREQAQAPRDVIKGELVAAGSAWFSGYSLGASAESSPTLHAHATRMHVRVRIQTACYTPRPIACKAAR